MNMRGLTKAVTGAALALFLLLGSGVVGTTAQADDRRWERDRRGSNSSYRAMQRQRAREMERRRQQERYRDRNTYGYGTRNYPYSGGYGSYGRYGGYNNSELQRGYRNGLNEGQKDARGRRVFDPNRHSSFRNGNMSYREGFHRGYVEGFRQYDRYYRRW